MNDENSGSRDDQASLDATTRKPYEPPALHVYGDIAELTRSRSSIGKTDGGHGAKSRTG